MGLYHPSENDFPCEVPTPKIDVAPSLDFTVADVLAWARTKPADGEYDFYNSGVCAVAQFGRATGRPHLVGIGDVTAAFPDFWVAVAAEPFTFGGLVDRLERIA